MEQTVKDRLVIYLKQSKLSKSNFCRRIGVCTSYINQIRVSIAPDKIKKITQEFPDLNISWLITGSGSMLNFGSSFSASYSDIINGLLSYTGLSANKFALKIGTSPQNVYEIQSGKRGISEIITNKIVKAYPEIRKEWILTGKGRMMIEPMVKPHPEEAIRRTNHELLQLLRATTIQLAQSQDIIEKNAENLTKAHEEIDNLLEIIKQLKH